MKLRIRSVLPGAVVLVLAIAGCSKSDSGRNPSGTLEATEIDLAPLVSGRVLEVRAEEGDRVAAGDTLIVIDSEPLVLERRQLVARLGSLDAQKNEAREARRQAEQRLELAETTLGRTKSLVEKGSATQQQLDDAKTQRDVAESQVRAARARLDVVDAQRGEAEASIAVADRRISDAVVVATTGGTVLLRSVEPGEIAGPGGVGLRIADLRTLELRIFLEADELDRVAIGDRLPVRVDALGDAKLSGTVSWVSSEAEFTPKNVQTREARAQLVYAVKLRIENPDGRLLIGMPAEVVLPASGSSARSTTGSATGSNTGSGSDAGSGS